MLVSRMTILVVERETLKCLFHFITSHNLPIYQPPYLLVPTHLSTYLPTYLVVVLFLPHSNLDTSESASLRKNCGKDVDGRNRVPAPSWRSASDSGELPRVPNVAGASKSVEIRFYDWPRAHKYSSL